jgi:hypothetical protein
MAWRIAVQLDHVACMFVCVVHHTPIRLIANHETMKPCTHSMRPYVGIMVFGYFGMGLKVAVYLEHHAFTPLSGA